MFVGCSIIDVESVAKQGSACGETNSVDYTGQFIFCRRREQRIRQTGYFNSRIVYIQQSRASGINITGRSIIHTVINQQPPHARLYRGTSGSDVTRLMVVIGEPAGYVWQNSDSIFSRTLSSAYQDVLPPHTEYQDGYDA